MRTRAFGAKGIWRSGLTLSVGLLLAALLVPQQATALSGSSFSAASIIDDTAFFNADTMSVTEIQNFLNAKVPTCDTNGTQPSNHSGYPTRADWGRAHSAPPPYTCLKSYTQSFNSTSADAYCGAISGGTKSAANIIYDVARACGINPQTLLVLLQKEQSLIVDDWPWPVQYRSATGYGCPDTAACDSQYYGFFNQVYNAGRQFKRYVQQPQLFNYAVGRNSYIAYNPNGGCGGTSMTLQNRATAALYNYTPYQPNAAALANLYGSGNSCSAYGNRNFWRLFNDWFGPTSGNGYVLAKSDDPDDLRQWVIYGTIKQYVSSAEIKRAWNLPDQPAEFTASYLDSISTGPNLGRVFIVNGGSTYYFVDNGLKYRLPSSGYISLWNLGGEVISSVSPDLANTPSDGGDLSHSIKNPDNDTKYMLDGQSGGQTVLRPYQSDTVMGAWEGSSTNYTAVSSDYFDLIDNAIGSALTHTKIGVAGSEFEVSSGVRFPLAASHASLFPGTAQQVSWETYLRLPQGNFMTHLVQSNDGPTVYLVDAGSKHQILWPDALSAWTGSGHGVTIVNSSFLSLLSTGSTVGGYTADVSGQLYLVDRTKAVVPAALDDAYRAALPPYTASAALMALYQTGDSVTGFIKSRTAPQVYLLDDSGTRRHLEWASKVVAYGGYQAGIFDVSSYVISAISTAAAPAVFVTDGDANYLMDGGERWTVSDDVKTDWGFGAPQSLADGTLDRFPIGGDLDNKFATPNGAYVLVRGGTGYATADSNIAAVWGIQDAPVMSSSLIPNTIPISMLTRFVHSSADGDNRTFVINNGEWFSVSATQLANLGGVGAPTMSLDPDLAPNSITDWTSVVIKSTGGTHYVIDGGGKRFFPHQIIQNQWTSNGSVTVPAVSDGFLALLPTRGPIERAIKGNAPQVYFYENGTKRHIRFSEVYHQSYAPFVLVTDQLLNVIPDGPVI